VIATLAPAHRFFLKLQQCPASWTFTKRFFIYSNVIVVFIFILSCLVPYLNPQTWWFISFSDWRFFTFTGYLTGLVNDLKPRLALFLL
jgi:hypothetical protein